MLKIDGEFVTDLTTSRTNQLVVKAVIDIARGLGQATIAEFVEDEETLELLRGMGVDYAQGYYVAKPAPLPLVQAPLPHLQRPRPGSRAVRTPAVRAASPPACWYASALDRVGEPVRDQVPGDAGPAASGTTATICTSAFAPSSTIAQQPTASPSRRAT